MLYYSIKLKRFINFFSSRYFIDYNAEDDRFFNIDANTGTIKTTKVLDREETPWYNITVAASENGKLYFMSHRKDIIYTLGFILRFSLEQGFHHFYFLCQHLEECTECSRYNYSLSDVVNKSHTFYFTSVPSQRWKIGITEQSLHHWVIIFGPLLNCETCFVMCLCLT